jgi:hypothetical protein
MEFFDVHFSLIDTETMEEKCITVPEQGGGTLIPMGHSAPALRTQLRPVAAGTSVPITDENLEYLAREAERLYTETDKAILANFGGTAFGDIALIPAPWLKHPKGIRDIEEL